MRIFLRKILSQILDKEKKQKLKQFEYDYKKKLIKKLPSLNKDSIRNIFINDLGIKEGDNLFIHASLDMINTDLSPLDILDILLNIIGKKGSLSTPTFIRYSSIDWMNMEKDFDLKKTPSGMGIFSERVRRYNHSKRSIHPTKSVSCIGNIADEILGEHHLDKFPFGKKSPFYKLMSDHNVKILGLGAPMSYLSMVHVIEDIFPDIYPLKVNENKIFNKNCILENKEIINVETYVHDLRILSKANPEKFVKKFMNKSHYQIKKHFLSPFFVVNGNELLKIMETQMHKGKTIYD